MIETQGHSRKILRNRQNIGKKPTKDWKFSEVTDNLPKYRYIKISSHILNLWQPTLNFLSLGYTLFTLDIPNLFWCMCVYTLRITQETYNYSKAI